MQIHRTDPTADSLLRNAVANAQKSNFRKLENEVKSNSPIGGLELVAYNEAMSRQTCRILAFFCDINKEDASYAPAGEEFADPIATYVQLEIRLSRTSDEDAHGVARRILARLHVALKSCRLDSEPKAAVAVLSKVLYPPRSIRDAGIYFAVYEKILSERRVDGGDLVNYTLTAFAFRRWFNLTNTLYRYDETHESIEKMTARILHLYDTVMPTLDPRLVTPKYASIICSPLYTRNTNVKHQLMANKYNVSTAYEMFSSYIEELDRTEFVESLAKNRKTRAVFPLPMKIESGDECVVIDSDSSDECDDCVVDDSDSSISERIRVVEICKVDSDDEDCVIVIADDDVVKIESDVKPEIGDATTANIEPSADDERTKNVGSKDSFEDVVEDLEDTIAETDKLLSRFGTGREPTDRDTSHDRTSADVEATETKLSKIKLESSDSSEQIDSGEVIELSEDSEVEEPLDECLSESGRKSAADVVDGEVVSDNIEDVIVQDTENHVEIHAVVDDVNRPTDTSESSENTDESVDDQIVNSSIDTNIPSESLRGIVENEKEMLGEAEIECPPDVSSSDDVCVETNNSEVECTMTDSHSEKTDDDISSLDRASIDSETSDRKSETSHVRDAENIPTQERSSFEISRKRCDDDVSSDESVDDGSDTDELYDGSSISDGAATDAEGFYRVFENLKLGEDVIESETVRDVSPITIADEGPREVLETKRNDVRSSSGAEEITTPDDSEDITPVERIRVEDTTDVFESDEDLNRSLTETTIEEDNSKSDDEVLETSNADEFDQTEHDENDSNDDHESVESSKDGSSDANEFDQTERDDNDSNGDHESVESSKDRSSVDSHEEENSDGLEYLEHCETEDVTTIDHEDVSEKTLMNSNEEPVLKLDERENSDTTSDPNAWMENISVSSDENVSDTDLHAETKRGESLCTAVDSDAIRENVEPERDEARVCDSTETPDDAAGDIKDDETTLRLDLPSVSSEEIEHDATENSKAVSDSDILREESDCEATDPVREKSDETIRKDDCEPVSCPEPISENTDAGLETHSDVLESDRTESCDDESKTEIDLEKSDADISTTEIANEMSEEIDSDLNDCNEITSMLNSEKSEDDRPLAPRDVSDLPNDANVLRSEHEIENESVSEAGEVVAGEESIAPIDTVTDSTERVDSIENNSVKSDTVLLVSDKDAGEITDETIDAHESRRENVESRPCDATSKDSSQGLVIDVDEQSNPTETPDCDSPDSTVSPIELSQYSPLTAADKNEYENHVNECRMNAVTKRTDRPAEILRDELAYESSPTESGYMSEMECSEVIETIERDTGKYAGFVVDKDAMYGEAVEEIVGAILAEIIEKVVAFEDKISATTGEECDPLRDTSTDKDSDGEGRSSSAEEDCSAAARERPSSESDSFDRDRSDGELQIDETGFETEPSASDDSGPTKIESVVVSELPSVEPESRVTDEPDPLALPTKKTKTKSKKTKSTDVRGKGSTHESGALAILSEVAEIASLVDEPVVAKSESKEEARRHLEKLIDRIKSRTNGFMIDDILDTPKKKQQKLTAAGKKYYEFETPPYSSSPFYEYRDDYPRSNPKHAIVVFKKEYEPVSDPEEETPVPETENSSTNAEGESSTDPPVARRMTRSLSKPATHQVETIQKPVEKSQKPTANVQKPVGRAKKSPKKRKKEEKGAVPKYNPSDDDLKLINGRDEDDVPLVERIKSKPPDVFDVYDFDAELMNEEPVIPKFKAGAKSRAKLEPEPKSKNKRVRFSIDDEKPKQCEKKKMSPKKKKSNVAEVASGPVERNGKDASAEKPTVAYKIDKFKMLCRDRSAESKQHRDEDYEKDVTGYKVEKFKKMCKDRHENKDNVEVAGKSDAGIGGGGGDVSVPKPARRDSKDVAVGRGDGRKNSECEIVSSGNESRVDAGRTKPNRRNSKDVAGRRRRESGEVEPKKTETGAEVISDRSVVEADVDTESNRRTNTNGTATVEPERCEADTAGSERNDRRAASRRRASIKSDSCNRPETDVGRPRPIFAPDSRTDFKIDTILKPDRPPKDETICNNLVEEFCSNILKVDNIKDAENTVQPPSKNSVVVYCVPESEKQRFFASKTVDETTARRKSSVIVDDVVRELEKDGTYDDVPDPARKAVDGSSTGHEPIQTNVDERVSKLRDEMSSSLKTDVEKPGFADDSTESRNGHGFVNAAVDPDAGSLSHAPVPSRYIPTTVIELSSSESQRSRKPPKVSIISVETYNPKSASGLPFAEPTKRRRSSDSPESKRRRSDDSALLEIFDASPTKEFVPPTSEINLDDEEKLKQDAIDDISNDMGNFYYDIPFDVSEIDFPLLPESMPSHDGRHPDASSSPWETEYNGSEHDPVLASTSNFSNDLENACQMSDASCLYGNADPNVISLLDLGARGLWTTPEKATAVRKDPDPVVEDFSRSVTVETSPPVEKSNVVGPRFVEPALVDEPKPPTVSDERERPYRRPAPKPPVPTEEVPPLWNPPHYHPRPKPLYRPYENRQRPSAYDNVPPVVHRHDEYPKSRRRLDDARSRSREVSELPAAYQRSNDDYRRRRCDEDKSKRRKYDADDDWRQKVPLKSREHLFPPAQKKTRIN